ncbi:hypothetical protein LB505_003054 [Fusarium chuoi]|nr:hypothetical protein LB505_003054 [Fusarium chuoi]
MRMVGVPESSLDHWVNQFIAKQYKVARVDQMETNLGKEMRERQDKSKKADKVITRELACILTAGTLVDGSILRPLSLKPAHENYFLRSPACLPSHCVSSRTILAQPPSGRTSSQVKSSGRRIRPAANSTAEATSSQKRLTRRFGPRFSSHYGMMIWPCRQLEH